MWSAWVFILITERNCPSCFILNGLSSDSLQESVFSLVQSLMCVLSLLRPPQTHSYNVDCVPAWMKDYYGLKMNCSYARFLCAASHRTRAPKNTHRQEAEGRKDSSDIPITVIHTQLTLRCTLWSCDCITFASLPEVFHKLSQLVRKA